MAGRAIGVVHCANIHRDFALVKERRATEADIVQKRRRESPVPGTAGSPIRGPEIPIHGSQSVEGKKPSNSGVSRKDCVKRTRSPVQFSFSSRVHSFAVGCGRQKEGTRTALEVASCLPISSETGRAFDQRFLPGRL